jgi:hypothetical protein
MEKEQIVALVENTARASSVYEARKFAREKIDSK